MGPSEELETLLVHQQERRSLDVFLGGGGGGGRERGEKKKKKRRERKKKKKEKQREGEREKETERERQISLYKLFISLFITPLLPKRPW